jgi:hypothetical protein
MTARVGAEVAKSRRIDANARPSARERKVNMNNPQQSNLIHQCLRRYICASWLLPLLLLALPAVVQAQFTYVITNGTVTITGYNGPGGAVTIPSTINVGSYNALVTSIGHLAFVACGSLTSVSIPSTVTNIGVPAFYNCGSLTAITVDAVNSTYNSVNGVLFNKSQTTLIQYPIGNAAISYTIPNSVTSIEDDAFTGCGALTRVMIPNSVTSIGYQAFWSCNGLTSVAVPDSVTSIGDCAFYADSSLTSITIGYSVTSMGDGAFGHCGLSSVTIPNSLTNIGEEAFDSCSRLTSLTIPSSVTSIGFDAFGGCTGLTGITVDALNCAYSSLDGVLFNKSLTALIQYPAGKAGSYNIANSVANIGYRAFEGCTGLTNIIIGTGLTSIGVSAFSYCASLTSIIIPGTVTNIEDAAFWRCTMLRSVMIPNSVTAIGGSAFSECTSLTSVTIPGSVTSIGDYAFYYCTSLTNVTVGNGVTSIGYWAFSDCYPLTSVFFTGNAPTVGSSPFRVDNFATAYYLPETTGWGTTFGGCPTALWTQVPTIQTSPQTQTAEATSAVGLRVQASSPLPLFYFWYLNATNLLSSGTNWQLNLPDVQWSQSGAYTVVISNVLGAVTSAPAMLNVIAPVERRPVPSIKVTGQAGNVLNLDYADSLGPAPNWTPLGSVSLDSTSQYYFDVTKPLPPQRFYRAWQTGTPGVRPSLDLHLVPALTLTGSIGHSVRVDYINQFGPIDAWVTQATVTLTNASQLYFDTTAPGQPQRLYRLVMP